MMMKFPLPQVLYPLKGLPPIFQDNYSISLFTGQGWVVAGESGLKTLTLLLYLRLKHANS